MTSFMLFSISKNRVLSAVTMKNGSGSHCYYAFVQTPFVKDKVTRIKISGLVRKNCSWIYYRNSYSLIKMKKIRQ